MTVCHLLTVRRILDDRADRAAYHNAGQHSKQTSLKSSTSYYSNEVIENNTKVYLNFVYTVH